MELKAKSLSEERPERWGGVWWLAAKGAWEVGGAEVEDVLQAVLKGVCGCFQCF